MKTKKNRKGLKIFSAIIISIVLLSSVAFGVSCAILGIDLVTAALKNIVAAPVNNFKAAWLYLTNDFTTIEEQLGETQKNFDDAVKEVTGIELSDEIKAALESGKYTEEEMALIISGVSIEEIERRRQLAEEMENQKNSETEQEAVVEKLPEPEIAEKEEPPVIEEPVEIIDEKAIAADIAATTAKMYSIKSMFMSKLESIENDIKKEFASYPARQRNPALRKSIAGKYVASVARLEVECDSEVDAVLQELKTKLVSVSYDLSVIDTIKKAYQDEKSLKKAYYLDVYINGVRDKKTEK